MSIAIGWNDQIGMFKGQWDDGDPNNFNPDVIRIFRAPHQPFCCQR